MMQSNWMYKGKHIDTLTKEELIEALEVVLPGYMTFMEKLGIAYTTNIKEVK